MDFATLGAAIARRRRELGLAQQELASLAGVSRPTIMRLETGTAHELGFNKVVRILNALRLDLRLTEANASRPTLEDLQSETASNNTLSFEKPLPRRVRKRLDRQRG